MNYALLFVPESNKYTDYISILYKGELSEIMTVLTKIIRHSYKKLNRYYDVEHLADEFFITKSDDETSKIYLPIVAECLTSCHSDQPMYQATFNGQIISLWPTPSIEQQKINFLVINYTHENELVDIVIKLRNAI